MTISNEPADTGSGILVGAQPAQPRSAADWAESGMRPDQQVSQPVQQPRQQPQQNSAPTARWTDDDIEAARRQEKEKLYPRIDEMSSQLRLLAEEREAEKAERDRLAAEAEEARRLREEGEMEVRDLLTKKEQEWQSQIETLNRRYETDREVFEKERRLQEAELYRRDRIAQESENILPELRDFIGGASPEEIDASIEAMKARTEAIVANFVAAEPERVPFQPRMGAAPTAPPVGPMEQLPSYESLSPDDIRGMDMDTYKRYRNELLRATSPTQRRVG